MKHYIGAGNPMRAQFDARAPYQARHFAWSCDANGVGTVSLNRPERKNPLTFDSYAELRDLFNGLRYATDVKVVVVTGEGGNFCSGGDVHDIIGPLTKMSMKELLAFTRMTGDLVKAIVNCGKPVIAAVDGVCAGEFPGDKRMPGFMVCCYSFFLIAYGFFSYRAHQNNVPGFFKVTHFNFFFILPYCYQSGFIG